MANTEGLPKHIGITVRPGDDEDDITLAQRLLVSSIANLALQLLETKEAKAAITELGRDLLRSTRHIYQDTPERMELWVDYWLGLLRQNFIPILLSHRCDGEADFTRSDWLTQNGSIRDWDTQRAGRFRINRTVSLMADNIVLAHVHLY